MLRASQNLPHSVALGWGQWAVGVTGEFSEHDDILAEPGFASQHLCSLTNL